MYLSIFSTGSVLHRLNYSIKVSVEVWLRWCVYDVVLSLHLFANVAGRQYNNYNDYRQTGDLDRFISSFSIGPEWFCKRRFLLNVFNVVFFHINAF